MAQKTSITQITVANDRIQNEVAMVLKMDLAQLQNMTRFVGKYISATMERGQMEAVMLPYFGKFKPKKSLQIEKQILARERNGMDLIYRAVKGKNLVDRRNKTKYDAERPVKPPTKL